MLAKFVAFHFPIRNLATNLSKNKLQLWYYVAILVTKRYINAIWRIITTKLFNKSNGQIVIRSINNIEQAANHLTSINPDFNLR